LRVNTHDPGGVSHAGDRKFAHELRAKYLIDASGRNSVIGSKFKLKKSYQHLQKLSLFAHYQGLEREEGIDGTLTRMVRTLQSWFWVIPLENDRTSIGIVLEAADFKNSGLSAEEFFERAIAEQPLVGNRAMDVYLRFVESWYGGKEFIEVFLTPTDLFQIPPAVNAVLGGNVGNRFAIRWRMELFYLIVRLQKRWTLCPRLSLVPKTNGQTEPLKPASI